MGVSHRRQASAPGSVHCRSPFSSMGQEPVCYVDPQFAEIRTRLLHRQCGRETRGHGHGTVLEHTHRNRDGSVLGGVVDREEAEIDGTVSRRRPRGAGHRQHNVDRSARLEQGELWIGICAERSRSVRIARQDAAHSVCQHDVRRERQRERHDDSSPTV